MNRFFWIIAMIFIGFGIQFVLSCSKKEDSGMKTIPIVTTLKAEEISNSTCEIGGIVQDNGGESIIERGVLYGLEPNPTFSDSVIKAGDGMGTFNCSITGLKSNTKYYYVAYAKNSIGIGYGEIESFVTGSDSLWLPTVSTRMVSQIAQTTAICGGEISHQGGSDIIARGVCWSTISNPTIENSHTNNGTGQGVFNSTITGLNTNTLYYVKAYATNSHGTSYGDEVSFTTLPEMVLPIVILDEITNITLTSANGGGEVISDGYGTVSARGVCWNMSGAPTLSNYVGFTVDGTGIGTFTSELSNLNPQTTYFVVAYATNEKGTFYSVDEKQFTTETPFVCGDSVYYEGQGYQTILIGSQCWFQENLNVGTMILAPEEQPSDNGIIEKYCYYNIENYGYSYGGLYTWNEMMQYQAINGGQGICPDGWHIPTESEFDDLINYLGGDQVAGGKMKECGTSHWTTPNYGATNSSGFTALGGGLYGFYFADMWMFGHFWTSTEVPEGNAVENYLMFSNARTEKTFRLQTIAFSVRCLKD